VQNIKQMKSNDKMQEAIRNSIKKIAREKGLTMAEVADRMGIKGPTLSQNINGNPTVEMLARIAAALQVDIRLLFESSGAESELYGMVQYKDRSYKIDSLKSLEQLLSVIKNA